MNTRRRTGYTLIELLAVVAVLVILGAVLVPTMRTMSGDSKVKAGADVIRARMAEARAAAIEEGRTYRVAVSTDGTRVQVSADVSDAGHAPANDDGQAPLFVEESLPDKVIATPVLDENAPPTADQAGWVRVATFLPDGTCREASAAVTVQEPGVYPITIRVRGLTGATTVTAGQPGQPGRQP